jgi:hypothetical protein
VVSDSEQSMWEASFTKHSSFLTGFRKKFFVLKTPAKPLEFRTVEIKTLSL